MMHMPLGALYYIKEAFAAIERPFWLQCSHTMCRSRCMQYEAKPAGLAGPVYQSSGLLRLLTPALADA